MTTPINDQCKKEMSAEQRGVLMVLVEKMNCVNSSRGWSSCEGEAAAKKKRKKKKEVNSSEGEV